MKPNKSFGELDATTVRTDELTLDGETRTSWPGGSSVYSTDPTTADDRVIVAETAADIQAASDTLDATNADTNPAGGRIQLKRKTYQPDSPIVLRPGVSLVGIQPERRATGDHPSWQYCLVSGSKIPTGEPIIETRGSPDNYPVQVRDLVVVGAQGNYDDTKHGIRVGPNAACWIDRVMVERCYGHGLWVDGGSATVTTSYVDGGDYRNGTDESGTYGTYVSDGGGSGGGGRVETHQTIFTSSGYSGGYGNDAVHYDAPTTQFVMTRCRLTSRNNNDRSNPRIAALRLKPTADATPPPQIGTATSITTGGEPGVDGMILETNAHLDGVSLDKCEVCVRQRDDPDASGQTVAPAHTFANVSVSGPRSHGIVFESGTLPQITNLSVRNTGDSDADADGIRFGDGPGTLEATNTATAVYVAGTPGKKLRAVDVPDGQQITITGGRIAGDGSQIVGHEDFYVRQIAGFVNEDKGVASIGSGSTTTTVTHGMDDEIAGDQHVHLTPHTALGNAASWWVSDATTGDGTFEIHLDSAPGQAVEFGWRVLGRSAVRDA